MAAISLTDAEKEQARRLADELKKLMDENFLQTSNPEVVEKTKSIRQQLEKMGFLVTVDYRLNPQKLTLNSDVQLWLPKQLH